MSYSPYRITPFAVLAIGLFHAHCLCAQSADHIKNRLFTEAPAKWEEYRSFAKQLQGKAIWQMRASSNPGGAPAESQLEQQFKQNAQSALIVSTYSPYDLLYNHAYGANSKYAFKLTRKDTTSRDWLLASLEPSPDAKIAVGGDSVGDFVLDQVAVHFFMADLHVSKVVGDQSFRVKQIGMVTRDGQQMVRIEFGFQPRIANGRNYPLKGGWMLLDPDHYWYVREYEITNAFADGSSIVHSENVVILDMNGRPILKRVIGRNKSTSTTKTLIEEGTAEFELTTDTKVPDSEFTLTAFGLPEPLGVEWPKRTSRWWWLVGAAFAALILAVLFRHLHRRSVAASLAKRGHNATQHPL